MEYFIVFLITTVLLSLIIIGLEALRGHKRGLIFSGIRLAEFAVSMVLSVPLTLLIMKPLTKNLVVPLLSKIENFEDIAALIPSLTADVLPAYISMLAAPIVYVVIIFAIFGLFSLATAIVRKNVIKDKSQPEYSKWAGLGISVITGFLMSIVLIAPFRGTFESVNTIATDVSAAGVDLSEQKTLVDIVKGGCKDPYGGIIMSAGGRIVYDTLSTSEIKGSKVVLKDEIEFVAKVGGKAYGIAGAFDDIKNIPNQQIEQIETIAGDFGESRTLSLVSSEFLSNASQNWLGGKSVLGKEKPDAGELINPTLDAVLEIFTTSDSENIVPDLDTTLGVFAILARNGILSVDTSNGFTPMLDKLGESGVINKIITKLGDNERMQGLAKEVTNLGIRALASAMNIPKNATEQFDNLMNQLSDSIKNASGNPEILAAQLEIEFKNYGIAVPANISGDVANALIRDMGDGEVTPDKVKEFFKVYAAASSLEASSGSSKTKNGVGISMLAEGESLIKRGDHGEAILPDGTILDYYTYDSIFNSAAFNMIKPEGNNGLTTLSSAAEMVTSVMNIENLLASGIITSENADAEGKCLENIIKTAAKLAKIVDKDDIDISEVLEVLGELMDNMSGSSLFGGEKTVNLLTAVLQSETVTKTTGYTPAEAKDLAETIKASAADEDSNYTQVMSSVSKAVSVVISTTDNSMTDDEREGKIKELMDDLTKSNAAVLEKLMTPSVLKKQGVPDASAEACANTAANLFRNLSEFEGSKEQYGKEAAAVNKLFKLALSSKDGKLNIKAKEFVADTVESAVVSKTLKQTAYGNDGELKFDALGLGSSFTEADKQETADELNKYYEEHSDAATAETLNAISAICALDVRY